MYSTILFIQFVEIEPLTLIVMIAAAMVGAFFCAVIVSKMDIKKILYISCDPATLARDMKYLTNLGYTPNYVQPVDMFPHTNHVENITVLTKE